MAPVGAPERAPPAWLHLGEVLGGEDAPGGAHRLDDGVRDRSAPHRRGSGGGDALQGPGELRLSEAGAERRDLGAAIVPGAQEDAGGLGVPSQALQPAGGHLPVLRGHHQPVASEADGRREDDRARERARLLQQREVPVHRVGDGDREPAVDGQPRNRLAVPEEHVAARRCRGDLAEVERERFLALPCDQREPASCESVVVRADHRCREGHGHGSVDGVASPVEHLEPGLRRLWVEAGDHAAAVRPGRVGGEGEQEEEQRGEEPGHPGRCHRRESRWTQPEVRRPAPSGSARNGVWDLELLQLAERGSARRR